MIFSKIAGRAAFAAAALAGLGLPAANAQSQDPVINPGAIVRGYDFNHIEPILKELGLATETVTFAQPGIGEATVLVGRASGTVLIFMPWACNSANANKCAGLIMRAYYSTQTSPALRNSFMERSQMGAVAQTGDVTYLQRYLIGDYGYTRGAFAIDVAVFARVANELYTTINGNGAAGNTISFDASATPQAADAPPGKAMPGDDFADRLNARQKIGNSPEATDSASILRAAISAAAGDDMHAAAMSAGYSLTAASAAIDAAYVNNPAN